MIVFLCVAVVLLFFYFKNLKPREENSSIGETKVVNGIEYFNIGNLDDQDNWIEVGSVIPQYYINVYETGEGFEAIIELERDSEAYVCQIKSVEDYIIELYQSKVYVTRCKIKGIKSISANGKCIRVNLLTKYGSLTLLFGDD